jgi:hypothetical protein
LQISNPFSSLSTLQGLALDLPWTLRPENKKFSDVNATPATFGFCSFTGTIHLNLLGGRLSEADSLVFRRTPFQFYLEAFEHPIARRRRRRYLQKHSDWLPPKSAINLTSNFPRKTKSGSQAGCIFWQQTHTLGTFGTLAFSWIALRLSD